ncbi:MAG TPA: acyl carrier protein [Patescibacteria group bacterium]|nr:acyl carrier protein [Patescibacteria group bacterium]
MERPFWSLVKKGEGWQYWKFFQDCAEIAPKLFVFEIGWSFKGGFVESIKERVRRVIFTEGFGFSEDSRAVVDMEKGWEELGVDSLSVVEMVMAIESEFGIEIPDGESDAFLCPQDLVTYLETLERS